MLKVCDKEAYVRLDAQYTFNFKQQATSASVGCVYNLSV